MLPQILAVYKPIKKASSLKHHFAGHVQNPPNQNPPSKIREPLTDRG